MTSRLRGAQYQAKLDECRGVAAGSTCTCMCIACCSYSSYMLQLDACAGSTAGAASSHQTAR